MLEIKPDEISQIVDLLERYEDIGPQVADVALVCLANREHVTHIFTFDRRDFFVYRDREGRPFELLPEARQ